jgi:Cu(I)/Ag(I) efflux system membrane protein CusA/SilA
LLNFLFVALIIASILGVFALLEHYYSNVLAWCLAHKKTFLSIPMFIILLASVIWMGFNTVFGFVSSSFQKVNVSIENTIVWSSLSESFPGIGKEFMPSLDEGSFLLMPTSMPHAGIEKNKRVVQQLDMILANIPEVELAVGKMGRTESALDPAPISMYENIINYKSEYALNEQGHRQRFKTDNEDLFVLTNGDTISNADAITQGITRDDLISDDNGQYFRNWRDHIQSSDDIWNEIIGTINLPGVTSAPKLQPIETRLVMLQTGMRAPMGIKVFGPDLPTIEKFGMELEQVLKEVPSVKTEAVFADRIVGKPYIHLNINREAISRYGLSVVDVQQTIETAIGGMQITTTVEGRERFPVRVRYPRELRDDPSSLNKIVVSTASGAHIPLGDLVDVEYVRGPQMIKSENTFLVGYVLLDKKDGFAEVDVVEAAQNLINERIDEGSIVVPKGVSYKFSGSYENQIRAEKRLAIVVPLVLVIIFLILYFQFKSISTSLMIFGGIAMAFSGAFLMLWFYSKGWFLNFSIFDTDLRDLFQIKTINLSVAVWVGFIALFGIATDDGVLIGTYLDHSFKKNKPNTVGEIRAAVSEAGLKRIKPAIMTTATTIIALLPVLTSTGRGADIMIPMAIPAFGGMIVASITYFITPVLYSMREEYNLKRNQNEK